MEPATEPEDRWQTSEYFRLLNGEWSFCWAEKPADVPDRLGSAGNWDTISVPSVWQLEGYDRPIYRNHALTWEDIPELETEPDPPTVPSSFNPVGTYRRTAEIPAEWGPDRRTYLHFEGVKSAFFVWIDGEYVGYDQGSMTPSEFDVTDALDPGEEHTLTVQVFRFSDGSYLETQDMLRFSGIFRSVYLYSKPAVHLRDFFVRTAFDATYEDATLSIDVDLAAEFDLSEYDRTDEWQVVGHLFDGARASVATVDDVMTPVDDTSTTLETVVERPDKWSAEQPALYLLVLELRAPDGSVREAIPQRIGFREFDIREGQLRLNGEPITIRGVNRHEHDPETGRTVSYERARAELRMMKRNNVNAVRASHYPNDLAAYELADELGLYVVDEANVETHFNMNFVNEAPAFHDAYVRRFERMVEHHKNFASIFAWSTSNEAGEGPAHEEMAAYSRERDPTRFVYHQGSGEAPYEQFHESMTGTAPFADISGPRYPVPYTLVQHEAVEERPLVMGEYAHALCNSLGFQDAFWDLVRSVDGIQGGFIWEWCNQTLAGDVVVGGEGVDWWFDDDPFLLDGVVFSDLTPQPELRQVKKTQQPFSFDAIAPREGVFTVTNEHDFTDLGAFETRWELAVDGRVVQTGTLDLAVPPSHTRGVIVPFERLKLDPGAECHLTLRVELSDATDWAPAGHEVGFEQFEIPFDASDPERPSADTHSPVTVEEIGEWIEFVGERFRYRFDTTQCAFDEFSYDDTVVATDGPLFGCYRVPVANEGRIDSATQWGYDNETEWEQLGLDALTHDVVDHTVTRLGTDCVRLTGIAVVRNPDGDALFDIRYRHTVFGDGVVATDIDVDATETLRESLDSWLPRLGVQFDLPVTTSAVEWFGRGPAETYPDRKTGSEVGRYAGDIDDQFVPYRLPSDNGNKTDVRWASVTGDGDVGVAVYGDQPFNLRFDGFENLATATRLEELAPKDGATMFVDAAVSGVGGTPVRPLTEYRLRPNPVSFSFAVHPYDTTADDPGDIARRGVPRLAATTFSDPETVSGEDRAFESQHHD